MKTCHDLKIKILPLESLNSSKEEIKELSLARPEETTSALESQGSVVTVESQ